jgi:hypothetical protein
MGAYRRYKPRAKMFYAKSFLALKSLSPKRKSNELSFSVDTNHDSPNGSSPTFAWEPQGAFSPAQQKFEQCYILS